jgi:hypothetical protein
MPSQRERVIKQAHERIARIRSELNAMDYFSSGTLHRDQRGVMARCAYRKL